MASDSLQGFSPKAFLFLVKASYDPRVCKQFKADNSYFLGLGLTKMLNQEKNVIMREKAAEFCLNVI